MMKKDKEDQKVIDSVMNAKTPEEKIKKALKAFTKEKQIYSAILYLAPEVVEQDESSFLITTAEPDLGTLSGQIQLDMMGNVELRNFLTELVDVYRSVRCPDDLIEDAFYYRGKLDVWNKISEGERCLEEMRRIANSKKLSDEEKIERLGAYIDRHFGNEKGGEA